MIDPFAFLETWAIVAGVALVAVVVAIVAVWSDDT